MRKIIAFAPLAFLCACTSTATMIPINQQAASIVSPKMQFTRGIGDSGDVTITMANGEILKGQYSITSGEFGSLGFGNIGRVPISQSMTNIGNRTAIVGATDGKTSATCDVDVSLHGHGGGTCQFSPGGEQYRVIF